MGCWMERRMEKRKKEGRIKEGNKIIIVVMLRSWMVGWMTWKDAGRRK